MRAFADYNPITVFVCIMSAVGAVMFTADPVMALIALVGGGALWLVQYGLERPGTLLFCLVLIVVMPIMNMLFSHNGATVLLVVNDAPLTLEALIYGAVSGVTLSAVLCWMACFSRIMTTDKLLYLLGAVWPKLALILTMALRFVPHFGRQFKKTDDAQKALGVYNEDNFIDLVRGKLRVFSIMVTWALENGITTADSIAARGYGTGRRTAFSLFRFRAADGIIIGICAALLTVCVVGMTTGAVNYSFYPHLDRIQPSPMRVAVYVCYGGIALLPTIIETEAKMRWRSLRSTI